MVLLWTCLLSFSWLVWSLWPAAILAAAADPEYSPAFIATQGKHRMNDKAAKTDYWDDWQREAIAAGISAPLAKLGMEMMRTHRKNRWPKEFLGREEDGPVMIEMCLEDEAETELFFIENLHPYDAKLIAATRKRLCID